MTLRSRALLLVAVVACGAGCAPSDEPSASADPSAGAGPSGNAHQDANAHETVQTRPRGTVSNIVLPETEGCAERDGLDHELAFIDPTLDGFGTEVLNSSAGKALKHLAVGLAADLPRLARSSATAALVELELLPTPDLEACAAVGADPREVAWIGGEDYELLIAGPVELENAGLGLHRVGVLTDGAAGQVTVR